MFLNVTADQLLVYQLSIGFQAQVTFFFSRGKGRSTHEGKISAQIYPWLMVDFSSDIPCTIVSGESP